MTEQSNRRVALVTGSTSGIGLEIAKALAEDGWIVALHGKGDPLQIQAALDAVAAWSQIPVRHFDADMREPQATRKLVEGIQETYGSLDLLVNNAGIQHIDRIERFPAESWDDVLAINLSAVFHATRAALPAMQAKGYGRIVNIASVHGLVASQEKAAYVAAKHGVVGLTKATALENAKVGITCNAVCPGWVLTPLVEAQIALRMERSNDSRDDVVSSMLAEKEPTCRFTTTDQVAGAVRFLVSPAADNITGVSLAMDGGWTAQ